jgi:hypothetical protein
MMGDHREVNSERGSWARPTRCVLIIGNNYYPSPVKGSIVKAGEREVKLVERDPEIF